MKTVFIIVAVVIGLALVFVFYCCCIVSGRCSRAEERDAILYRSLSEPPHSGRKEGRYHD